MKQVNLLFLSTTVSSLIEREWISAEVGNTAGLKTTSVRKEVHSTSSLRHCMGLATRHDWAYLACYLPSEGCSLFEMKAITDGSVTRDETLGQTECKVRRDLTLCLGRGSVGFLGDNRHAECANEYTCTVNGWEGLRLDTSATTCDASQGFSMIAGMCLFISTDFNIFCDARSDCRDKGGEIASFETAELFDDFRQYLMDTNHVGAFSVFVGLVQSEEGWAWKFNNRYPGDTVTGDWGSADIIQPEHKCSIMQHSDSFLMRSLDCSTKMKYVCRLYF